MRVGNWGSAIAPQVSVVFCPEYSERKPSCVEETFDLLGSLPR